MRGWVGHQVPCSMKVDGPTSVGCVTGWQVAIITWFLLMECVEWVGDLH